MANFGTYSAGRAGEHRSPSQFSGKCRNEHQCLHLDLEMRRNNQNKLFIYSLYIPPPLAPLPSDTVTIQVKCVVHFYLYVQTLVKRPTTKYKMLF